MSFERSRLKFTEVDLHASIVAPRPLSRHLSDHLGRIDWGLSVAISAFVGAEVCVIPNSHLDGDTVIVTAELSPASHLAVRLPSGWDFSERGRRDACQNWPLRKLGDLMRLRAASIRVEATDAFVEPRGQTMSACTRMTGLIALPQTWLPPMVEGDAALDFLAVVPLYPEEIAWLRDHGSKQLARRLTAEHADERIMPTRRRVV